MTTIPLQPAAFSENAKPRTWHPDGWCFRGVTTTLAVAVSAMYGLLLAAQLGSLGAAVLIGAGLAWPMLLLGVWTQSDPAWRFARLDWCLWTMTVGSVAMTLGLLAAATNALLVQPVSPLVPLLGGLLIADVAMSWVLTRYAPTVNVARPLALTLWVGGMNGFLAAVCGLAALLERTV